MEWRLMLAGVLTMLSAFFAVAIVMPAVYAESPPRSPRLDRLKRLAVLIEELPAERFDMRTWASRGVGPDDPTYVGCAGGWATRLFAPEGFQITRAQTGSKYITVQFNGLVGLHATRAFFGLDEQDNRYLFTAMGDPGLTPRVMSERIRQVIRSHNRSVVALSLFSGRSVRGMSCPNGMTLLSCLNLRRIPCPSK
jgi:hypothetical protein